MLVRIAACGIASPRAAACSLASRRAASDADRDPVAPGYARHSAAVDPERADALERGVDAVLHGIEDVEAAYEHELVAVRDDLRRTLAELIAARTSAARRLAAVCRRGGRRRKGRSEGCKAAEIS